MGVSDDLDFTEAMADQRNVFFAVGGFCAMFIWSAPRVYECHIMALPAARGRYLYTAGSAMLAFMKDIGAEMVWGQPAVGNLPAQAYIRRMGLVECGTGHNPLVGPVRYFVTRDMQCRQQ